MESALASSQLLKRVVIVMHGLCIAAAFFMPVIWPIRFVLGLPLGLSLVFSLKQLDGPLNGLSIARDGTFSVRLKDGDWVPADVLGSSFVKPWLTILHLRLEGRRSMLPVILLPDCMPTEDFRRLRMWLLWGRKRVEER